MTDDQVELVPALISDDQVAPHMETVHGWPTKLLAEATDEQRRAWHDAEHRVLAKPKDAKVKRHRGHLKHEHRPLGPPKPPKAAKA